MPTTNVAILLLGPYTGLNYTVCAFQRHIVTPLQQVGCAIHLFYLVSKTPSTPADLLRHLPGVELHALHLPAATHFPTTCSTYVQSQYGGPAPHDFLLRLFHKREADWQWRRVARERGLRIDWVVCLSAAVVVMDPLPDLASLSRDQPNVPEWGGSDGGLNDWLVITTPRATALHFKLYTFLCVRNRQFPPKSDSGAIYQWYIEQANLTYARTLPTRYVTVRSGPALPMEQETPAFFNPEHLVCANYRYMRIAWRVRALQLECRDAARLDSGPDAPYPVPKCVWPVRKTMRGRNATHILQHLKARI
eukprot:EG_transcript_17856